MAYVTKRTRLANRGRRRNMTPKQIKFFGTKRQKAALRRNRSGLRRKTQRMASGRGSYAQYQYHMGRKRARGYRVPASAYRRNQGEFVSGIGSTAGGLITRAEQAVHRVERAAEDALDKVTSRLNRGRRNRGRRNSGRRRNVGEILTVIPAGNPGRRRKRRMAYRTPNRRRRNRRRRNWRDPRTGLANRRRRRVYNRRRRRHNPSVRYMNRRRRRMFNRRRRNPGFMTGTGGAVVGILGGAAVTKIITGFLPSTLMSGWAGYLTTGVTAVVTGQVAGRVLKNRPLGKWITIGGLLIVALEVVNQFMPSLQLPFGLSTGTSGLGLISSSNFYVPQVNLPGSMASFVTPAGVTGAIPVVPASGMSGIGGPQFSPGLRTMRRIGRMR